MPSDPIILGFDTSAAHCAAALLLGGKVTARIDPMAKGQAEHLMPMLEGMLSAEGLKWADLSAIAVGIGPGNFTGIRISVAAARGLALGLGKPAIGVSLLEAQAANISGMVVSSLDARRDRVYMQAFCPGPQTEPALCALRPEDMPLLPAKPQPQIVGFRADDIGEMMGWQPVQAKTSMIENIARIASRRVDSTKRPTPLYIRAADAAPSRIAAPVILS
ncbi:MAG: tRNA (adenosine(37)-N6)-threonylcarbamoyltransferase complex dimerization subunit type 1 TsaB [Rhodobacteraceae bacterium]|nr:tRNA (adenosine(37)-N6)-threonylcarbamoyltransferase complex dimerization subunit type 1 TsaB [Paracoccaceae bacterium]